jgi:hypothetical protein
MVKRKPSESEKLLKKLLKEVKALKKKRRSVVKRKKLRKPRRLQPERVVSHIITLPPHGFIGGDMGMRMPSMGVAKEVESRHVKDESAGEEAKGESSKGKVVIDGNLIVKQVRLPSNIRAFIGRNNK